MDRNVLLALGAAQEAWREGGLNGFDPARVGIVVGSAIGGLPGIVEQQNVLRDRGPDRVSPFFIPSVLVDSASGQIAISLGLRGPNYAPVSACATGSRGRRGRRADPAGRRRRRSRGRDRVVHPPADPGRLLRDARARRRGRGSDEGLASVRRDPRRVRDVGGRLHPAARGAGVGAGARRDDLRRGARLRRLQRRAPHGPARARGDRGRRDDARRARALRASSRSRSATSTRTAPRRRSATRPRRGRSSRSSATTPTSSRFPRRSRSPATASGPPARSSR